MQVTPPTSKTQIDGAQAAVLSEVAVVDPTTNDPSRERGLLVEQCRDEDLYERRTIKQKVVLGILYAVVALEALYLVGLVVMYITDWFVLLLAAAQRLKRLRS